MMFLNEIIKESVNVCQVVDKMVENILVLEVLYDKPTSAMY